MSEYQKNVVVVRIFDLNEAGRGIQAMVYTDFPRLLAHNVPVTIPRAPTNR